MTKIAAHSRIPFFPYAASLQGARLDNLREEFRGGHHDLIIEYQQFSANIPPKIHKQDGKLYELVQGKTIPRRLRFLSVEEVRISGVYKKLDGIALEHPAREIRDMLHWIPAGRTLTFYLLFNSSQEQDGLRFYARQVVQEKRNGESGTFSFERDWSSPPPTRVGLVPQPKKLYERFGGDPITIRFSTQPYHRRLFIGSLDNQLARRPNIDCVLNLGEKPSKWAKRGKLPVSDRWENKGEGVHGMSLDEIRFEVEWVMERLKAGKRVLVHCVAGMNRSSTICCAVLMMLEGLSPEQALARVREHHPWARPDSNHWLKLRWLAERNKER
jgi:Dual specificity phosphatase, catalytic domain